MPAPTTQIGFSNSIPAAPSGDQVCTPQTDGGAPLQKFDFIPKRATTSLYGTVLAPTGGFVSAGEIQQETFIYAADTGSANAYAVAISPAPTLVAGSVVVFKAVNGNTGASTLAVNGGSAIALKKDGNAPLSSGDIAAGQIVQCIYDGTNFQAIGLAPAAVIQPALRGSNITSSSSASSLTVTLPSGAAAGDLAIIFANSGWAPTVPSGWTNLSIASQSTWQAIGAYKLLSSGDISTGSVSVSFGGTFDCVLAIVVFDGPTAGIRETQSGQDAGDPGTITNTTSSAVLNTDAAIYFASVRDSAAVVPVITPGSGSATSLQNAHTSTAWSLLADQSMPGGVLAVASLMSNAGGGCTAAQVIVEGIAGEGSAITGLTGDVSATGPGVVPATLATVNSDVGSYTNANIIVDGKGRVTAASSGGAAIYFGQGSATAASGNNKVTLGSTPLSGSLLLFVSGALVDPGTYTISGNSALLTSTTFGSGNVVIAFWATSNSTPGGITLSTAGTPETIVNVQSKASLGVSVTTTSNVTAGNLLVVMAGWEASLGTATCSDTLGTTYTRRINQGSAGNNNTVMFSGVAPSSGACTATIAGGSSSFAQTSISEFSGVQDVVDVSTSGDGNASTPTPLSVTTTAPGDLIFMGVSGNHNATTYTAGSGYTMNNFINGNDAQATQWQQQSSAGSISGTFNATDNDDYSMGMVAFKAIT